MAKINNCDDLPELCQASSIADINYSIGPAFDIENLMRNLDGIENVDRNFGFGVINKRILDSEISTENKIFSMSISSTPGVSKGKRGLSKDPAQLSGVINKLIPKPSFPSVENNSLTSINSKSIFGKLMLTLTMEESPRDPVMKDQKMLTKNQEDSFPPQDVVLYTRKSINLEGNEIKYYIEAAPGKILQKVDCFKAFVRRPDGSSSQLILHLNDKNSLYYCSFWAFTAGPYILSLTLNTEGSPHVKGSPVAVQVFRDYGRNYNSLVILGVENQPKLLTKPWGVDVYQPRNHIYLSDRENHRIVMLDERGRTLKTFGESGPGQGQFCRPTGVAVDEVNKRLIISDKDNHRICIYSLEGNFLSCFGHTGHKDGEFMYPWGVAISPDGEIIAVADSRNFRIQLFDKDGRYLRKYSVFEVNPFEYKTQFQSPRGIIFDKEGQNMYVTDFNIHALFKINLDCTKKTTVLAPGHVERPQGIAIDGAGNLLICDSKNNCIRVVSSSSGHLLKTLKRTGNGARYIFTRPMDLAILKDGKIAVVDTSGVFRIF